MEIRKRFLVDRLVYIAAAAGILFYFIDSFVDGVLLGQSGFTRELLAPSAKEIWIRVAVFVILIVCAIFCKKLLLMLRHTEQKLKVAHDTANLTKGSNLFKSVAKMAAEAYNAKYACVGELAGDGHIETIAVWTPEGFADNVVRRIKGTPCEAVFHKGDAFYPEYVGMAFPDDTMLAGMNVDSYRGVVIRDNSGDSIGILSVMHDKPMLWNEPEGPGLDVFADRLSAEIKIRKIHACPNCA